MGIFDPADSAEIKRLAADAVLPDDPANFDRAVSYLHGIQLGDVQSELRRRAPSSQDVDAGLEIMAQTLPLTERFITESANAYDRGVKRKVVDPTGTESAAAKTATDAVSRLADKIELDENLCQVDQYQNLVKSCGLWPIVKRGEVKLRLVFPQHVAKVKGDEQTFDGSDPDDYRAFIVSLGQSGSSTSKSRFAWVSRTEVAYFEGMTAKDAGAITSGPHTNPWVWPQDVPGNTEPLRGRAPPLRPLMPIMWWHLRPPTDTILPGGESQIADFNRELNLHWSALMDTYRYQSFDTMVKTLADPDDPKAKQRHGARFPVIVGHGDSVNYVHSGVSYTDLVGVLVDFQRTFVMLKRMSGNDFSIRATAAISGFAKLVDSLPKLEAREARIRRLRRMEAEMLWPRLCAILIWLGDIPESARSLRLVTEFPDVSFPKTPEEVAKELETDFRYNLDTPAHVYARRRGVSLDEAKKAIMENAQTNREIKAGAPEEPGQPTQPQPAMPMPALGSMIGRRSSNAQREREPEQGRPPRRGVA